MGAQACKGNHGFLDQLGVVPVTYGAGLADRLAPLAPHGVDVVLDAAGKGSLAELVAIAGDPHRVVTIADSTPTGTECGSPAPKQESRRAGQDCHWRPISPTTAASPSRCTPCSR
ncbi:hypothetical protein WAB15_03090 [Streptomyces sirii]|uniref:Zinc-binding dehydrogenase n=1 Tax=Streptomyces sirii TaxID=3127701 RepID=A0ABZ2QL83_9ACTN